MSPGSRPTQARAVYAQESTGLQPDLRNSESTY